MKTVPEWSKRLSRPPQNCLGNRFPRVNIQLARNMPFRRIFTASLLASLAPLFGLSAWGMAMGAPHNAANSGDAYSLVQLLRTAAQLESGKPGKAKTQLEERKDQDKIEPGLRSAQSGLDHVFTTAENRARQQAQEAAWKIDFEARPVLTPPDSTPSPLRC